MNRSGCLTQFGGQALELQHVHAGHQVDLFLSISAYQRGEVFVSKVVGGNVPIRSGNTPRTEHPYTIRNHLNAVFAQPQTLADIGISKQEHLGKTGVTADRDKIDFRLFNSSSIFNITLREELFCLPKQNQIMRSCPGFMALVT